MYVVVVDFKFYWRFFKIFEKLWLILKENIFCVCIDNIYILLKSRIFDKNMLEKKLKVLF